LAAFENDLTTHQVKLLAYNSQASDPIAERTLKIAKASKVPVVGASETEPPGHTYQAWMTSEVAAVNKALSRLTQ
jgi:zinc/manganese transport system substrate-binding protein